MPQGRGDLATSVLGTVTDTLTTYDPATGIETETITSSTGPTIVRRSLHGVLLSTETTGETTYNSYDAFARVAQTWRAAVSAATGTGGSPGGSGVSPLQSYDYSPAGDLLATHTYTPDNLLLRTTYASGKWKENVYDAQRRLCGVIYSSPDMDYELQLDDYGNATNVQDATGNSWRYEYGFNSQLLSEEYITTGGTRSCASASTNNISRSYDSVGRPIGYVLTVNHESKGSIVYAYDDDNRISYITATNSAGRSFTVAYTNNAGYNYGYTITTPSGNTIRRVVDRDDYRRNLVTNCVTYFNSSLVDSNTYAFDALSHPIARTTGTTGVSPVDASFTYNNRSEVVSAAIGTNLFTHAYDDIGNHLLFGDNAVTNTFTHNALNQMVGRAAPSAPPTSFTYTPDGGLSSDGTWSYAYDAEDQLTSATSSSLTNGAIRVLNTYDYRRRRTSKTVQRISGLERQETGV